MELVTRDHSRNGKPPGTVGRKAPGPTTFGGAGGRATEGGRGNATRSAAQAPRGPCGRARVEPVSRCARALPRRRLGRVAPSRDVLADEHEPASSRHEGAQAERSDVEKGAPPQPSDGSGERALPHVGSGP